MFLKATLTLLAAALALATPGKRQSEPDLAVSLTNIGLAVTAEYNASTDGTGVLVDSPFAFDVATVECIEVCIPEYHCTLYDKNYTPFITLPPGTTPIGPSRQVGLIVCGSGLPDSSTAPEARQTIPYDGAAVFSNNQTGWETGFAFQLGQTVSLDERTQYYTSAGVQDITVPPEALWGCEAFDEDGGSLGIFFRSERFIYSFVPGVVASFLCD